MHKKKQIIFICLTLIVTSLIAYEPIRYNDFVEYDDEDHITKNQHVLKGLTKEGFVWAFTETDLTANWHPLTWLSHMMDVQLFGDNPVGHHLVSLLFHIINTLLLFWIFCKTTKKNWQSFFVAVIFALHPLHVESVAWASERKDVLSGLFWMLTIVAYIRYTKKPAIRRYVLIILLFTAGLMAKPMLVTLPFVLLLLDYWPLERFYWQRKIGIKLAGKLIAEKIPLFLLSAVSSVITFLVQQHAGAMIRGQNYTLMTRISNAAVAYITYIAKLFYPANLAVLYPHPGNSLLLWKPIAASVALILISMVVFYRATKNRHLLVGWLWYVGVSIPVIGLVQVGSQSVADRYTYLPVIGLCIMVAWGVTELLGKWKYRKITIGLIVPIIMLALVIGTRNQVAYWKNTITLYEHTLEVTENNYVVLGNYGCALCEKGDMDRAIDNFNKALLLKPDYIGVLSNLGMALRNQGKIDEAIVQWQKVLKLKPDHSQVNAYIGLALTSQGRPEEAIQYFRTALQANSTISGIHLILGIIYKQKGNYNLAAEYLIQAVKKQPDNIDAIGNLAMVYVQQGKVDEAIKMWNKVLVIDPKSVPTHLNLAFAMAQKGQHHSAIGHYNSALQIEPDQPATLSKLATSCAAIGNFDQAIEIAEKALSLAINAGDIEMNNQIQKQIDYYKEQASSTK